MTEETSDRRWRFFDDDPRHLDRFGALLALSAITVVVNMLIDLEDPTEDLRNEIGWIFVTVVSGATLILAANASGVSKRWRRIITLVVGLATVLAVLISILSVVGADPETVTTGRPSLLWVIIASAAPFFVLRRIFQHQEVTGQTLAGAVSVFLLIAMAFSYLLGVIDQWMGDPVFGSPEPTTTFMYFSLVTITTLGYGDISPATNVARMLATSEAVIGQIFLVTVVARLVSLYGKSPTHVEVAAHPDDDPTDP